MKAKVLIGTLFMLAVVMGPLFAAEDFSVSNIGGKLGDVENPFGPLISLFQSWLTSFLFGALFAIRFAKDILNAYVDRNEHPEAMKRAVIRFAVTLVFVSVVFHMIAAGLGSVVTTMFLT